MNTKDELFYALHATNDSINNYNFDSSKREIYYYVNQVLIIYIIQMTHYVI